MSGEVDQAQTTTSDIEVYDLWGYLDYSKGQEDGATYTGDQYESSNWYLLRNISLNDLIGEYGGLTSIPNELKLSSGKTLQKDNIKYNSDLGKYYYDDVGVNFQTNSYGSYTYSVDDSNWGNYQDNYEVQSKYIEDEQQLHFELLSDSQTLTDSVDKVKNFSKNSIMIFFLNFSFFNIFPKSF